MMIQQMPTKRYRPMRRPSFLHTSLRLDGVTHLIEVISDEPLTSTRFFLSSQIKFKSAFLKYVKYCVDSGFITKYYSKLYTTIQVTTEIYEKHPKKYHVMYKITDLGRHWLEITQ